MVSVGGSLLQAGVWDVHLFAEVYAWLEKVRHEENLQDEWKKARVWNRRSISSGAAEVQQKLEGTYHQQGHEGPLQEPHQHVAPVVFIIRHPGQSRVN